MPSGLRRVEGVQRDAAGSPGSSPVAGILRTATRTPSGSILTVLMYNSRLPSSKRHLIDWMALTIRFKRPTCCSLHPIALDAWQLVRQVRAHRDAGLLTPAFAAG